jgi:hypothetical protein
MRHDGLGKLPAKYTHSRLSKWRRKQVEVKRRALYGFASPLNMELKESEEEGIDELSEEGSSEDVEREENDRREVSVMLGSPKGRFEAKRFDQSVRITIVEVDELEADPVHIKMEESMETAKEARIVTSVHWSWGEYWV